MKGWIELYCVCVWLAVVLYFACEDEPPPDEWQGWVALVAFALLAPLLLPVAFAMWLLQKFTQRRGG